MRLAIMLICGGLISASAFAVSRIGTGKLSNDEIGFVAPVPQIFNSSFVFESGDVRFEGPLMMNPAKFGPPQPVYLLVQLLSNRLPDWIGKTDRAAFHSHFVQAGWLGVPHAYPCIEQFFIENATNGNWILSWGNGQGIVMTAPNLKLVNDRLRQMAAELELINGVCAWN